MSKQKAPKFTPIGDLVLIKRDEKKNISAGGIYIPDSARKTPRYGTVVKVGKGRTTTSGTIVPLGVKPGDRVVFDRYAGIDLTIEEVEYSIMKEECIFAVYEDSK